MRGLDISDPKGSPSATGTRQDLDCGNAFRNFVKVLDLRNHAWKLVDKDGENTFCEKIQEACENERWKFVGKNWARAKDFISKLGHIHILLVEQGKPTNIIVGGKNTRAIGQNEEKVNVLLMGTLIGRARTGLPVEVQYQRLHHIPGAVLHQIEYGRMIEEWMMAQPGMVHDGKEMDKGNCITQQRHYLYTNKE